MSRRLIVSSGSDSREFVLVGTIVVGRDPACDISDGADPLLSRRHAEFSNASEATVRDLGSRNGILVNGVKMPHAVLRGGDVVQVGHLQVKFVDELGPFKDVPGVQPEEAPTFAESDKPTVRLEARTVAPDDLAVTRKLPS